MNTLPNDAFVSAGRGNVTVSVIIPAYNAEPFLARTLASVFNQTHPPTEVIVVDDGSADGTSKVALNYPVKLICQKNGGPAKARNAGILAATGEWIAFLDHDDSWYPEKLETQISLIGPDVAAICTPNTSVRHAVTFEEMFWRNHGGSPSSSLISREVLLKLGLFNDDARIKGVDDYNFWLKFVWAGYKFRASPKLHDFTPAIGHYSGNGEKMLRAELFNIHEIARLAGIAPSKVRLRQRAARLEYLPGLVHDRQLSAARHHLLRLGICVEAMRYWYAFLPRPIIDLKRQVRKLAARG